MIAERIVSLYSPSGVGKTSLVQAALIPELEQEGFHVLPPLRAGLPWTAPAAGANRYILSLLQTLEEAAAPSCPEGWPAPAGEPHAGRLSGSGARALDR